MISQTVIINVCENVFRTCTARKRAAAAAAATAAKAAKASSWESLYCKLDSWFLVDDDLIIKYIMFTWQRSIEIDVPPPYPPPWPPYPELPRGYKSS